MPHAISISATKPVKPAKHIDWQKHEQVYLSQTGPGTSFYHQFMICTGPSKRAQDLAAGAIRTDLFDNVESYPLNALLHIHGKNKGVIAIVGCIHTPLGVALVAQGRTLVYIDKKARRKGLGSDLVSLLRFQNVQPTRPWAPDRKAKRFWQANGVDVP